MVRAEVEQQEEVERDMIEEERWVLGEAIRVGPERQARAEAMGLEGGRQVEAERQAADEEVAWMGSERQSAVMKRPLEFSFRLCSIYFPLEFVFRLYKIYFSLEFNFR